MKIVIMYDFLSEYGGIERVMTFQAKALRKAGHEVVFAFAYVDRDIARDKIKNFKVFEYGRFPWRNETLGICSTLITTRNIEEINNADLIICHSFPASYYALGLKKRYGIPYILMLHHPPQFIYNSNWNWAKNSSKRIFAFIMGRLFWGLISRFDKYCVNNASDYMTAGKTVNRIIEEVYGIRGEPIYPAVDPQFYFEPLKEKEKIKIGLGKDYILASGRIVQQKRFDYLIKAASLMKNKNCELVFAGKSDPRIRKSLINLAKELGVREPLFLGNVDIELLRKIYSSARVTVLTCPKEWFGLVPVEAMSCGCPVVAWNDGFGPGETIADGVGGLLARPYDERDMARKIDKALEKNWDRKKVIHSVNMFSEKSIEKLFMNKINGILKRIDCI